MLILDFRFACLGTVSTKYLWNSSTSLSSLVLGTASGNISLSGAWTLFCLGCREKYARHGVTRYFLGKNTHVHGT